MSKKGIQINNEYTPNNDIWRYVRGKCQDVIAIINFDRRKFNVVKNVSIVFPTKIWSKLSLWFYFKGIRALTIDKDNAPKVVSRSYILCESLLFSWLHESLLFWICMPMILTRYVCMYEDQFDYHMLKWELY